MSAAPSRIFIVAEHASLNFGGEAAIPYHYFRVLRARGADAWLVVHERSRADLEALLPEELSRIIFVADRLTQKVFFRLSALLPRRISEATLGLANQLLTQGAQKKILRRLLTPDSVVHQPIPVSPRFPSRMYGLGVPVVVGPLNGGMTYPPVFRKLESGVVRFAVALGRFFTDFGNSVFPGKQRAAVVLVANSRTLNALPSGILGRVVTLVENGVDLARWQPADVPLPPAWRPGARFVFLGRLVDWKALDIVLDALVSAPDVSLDVIGDGPMLAAWQARAVQIGIGDRVHFLNWQPQQECAALLAGADGLVLPSLFECGGAVVLEAMAMAKPVIATAWGGPADYLDETCGILVPPANREAMVRGFAAAMRRLSDTALGRTMGEAGRRKVVAEYDWEKKVDRVLDLYAEVRGSR